MKAHFESVPMSGRVIPVIRPVEVPPRILICADTGYRVMIWADDDGLRFLAKVSSLAGTLSDAVVYVPTSGGIPSWSRRLGWIPHDLVLCHHSLQLDRSKWKRMRQYLKGCRPRNLSVPPVDAAYRVPYEARKERADVDARCNTAFVVGSRKVFRHLAAEAIGLVGEQSSYRMGHLGYLARHRECHGISEDLGVAWTSPEEWLGRSDV